MSGPVRASTSCDGGGFPLRNGPWNMSQSITKHPISYVAAVLSYLIPGLGQIYQGRVGKGVMFMICLLTMFIGGQAMGDWKNVYLPASDPREDNAFLKQIPVGRRGIASMLLRWHYGGQFWIGIAAWPAIWQYYSMPVPSMQTSPFWHNFQKSQSDPRDPEIERDYCDYVMRHDKDVDVSWVYTVVAGILNILVIYDALAGPAHSEEEAGK